MMEEALKVKFNSQRMILQLESGNSFLFFLAPCGVRLFYCKTGKLFFIRLKGEALP